MKITKSQLKQIIMEELMESGVIIGELGGVASALGVVAGRPDSPPDPWVAADSDTQRRAEDFFMNLVITDKVATVLVNNIAIPDLISVMKKIPKIDTADQEDVFTEEKENNPWAICTAQVGREDKEKYEKCVKSVKKQNRSK